MLKNMRPGSVLVDLRSIQGGCAETSRATTHHDPIYVKRRDPLLRPNMPGAYARTSKALSNATAALLGLLADLGLEEACKKQPAAARRDQTRDGRMTYAASPKLHGLKTNPRSKRVAERGWVCGKPTSARPGLLLSDSGFSPKTGNQSNYEKLSAFWQRCAFRGASKTKLFHCAG